MSVYEALTLDEEFESRARTISARDVEAFAGLTGDMSALHLDDRVAAASPYGRRIAHGMLIVSCSIGLATEMNLFGDALLALAGVDKLRFTAPVFIDDSITVRKRVIEKQRVDAERAVVTFDTRVLNQHADIVAAYVDKYLLRASVAL